MNVLSLCDGCAGAHLALKEAGIDVTNYFASEIDDIAMQVARLHFPNIIHIGDIKTINPLAFGDMFPSIDLIIGGTPCQGFSLSGYRKGLLDERSRLIFKFIDLVKSIKPKWFLLENVKLNEKENSLINDLLGVKSVTINSAHFTAQNRKRSYWTNIPLDLNYDGGALLVDIIKDLPYTKDYLRKTPSGRVSYCKQIGYTMGNYESTGRVYSIYGKSPTITTMSGGDRLPKIADPKNKFLKYRDAIIEECEILQGYPEDFTRYGQSGSYVNKISDTNRKRLIGNGFSIPVISEIVKPIKDLL